MTPLLRLLVAGACVWLGPTALGAQAAPPAQTEASAPPSDPPRSHRPSRLYFGMWTTHLKNDVVVLDNNWVAGLSFRGYFGATFLNSFGRRAFSGGIERTLVSTGEQPIDVSLGVRLGFVTGYDGRLMRIARNTPVLPLLQPFVSADVHRLGFEVSYTFVVVSAVVSYRF